MITIALTAVHVLLCAWFLWVFFLAVMCLQAARDRKQLTVWNTRFGYTVLVVGWLLDFVVQVTLAALLFWEWPRELTVSGRVKRLIADDDGWRGSVAAWIRDHLLRPFDATGRHG